MIARMKALTEMKTMNHGLDDFVRDLQEQIFEDTRQNYGEVVFERWLHPRHMGTIVDADGYARVTGPCGDTMEIFLRFEDDRVADSAFRTDGCGSSMACGSLAAEMARGKTPDDLLDITGESILERAGGLPAEEERHCAFLAAETLQEALNTYMLRQRGRSKP